MLLSGHTGFHFLESDLNLQRRKPVKYCFSVIDQSSRLTRNKTNLLHFTLSVINPLQKTGLELYKVIYQQQVKLKTKKLIFHVVSS